MRILLIDEDEILIDALQKNLAEKNYVLDAVTDGEQGWIYGSTYTYDLIILDRNLPKLDGLNLCYRFRTQGYYLPILVLTSSHRHQDKIMALDAGADDCLCKPINFEELAARIRALLRRSNSNSLSLLSWGDLQLNMANCQVTYQGNLVLLTTKEYQLLELFMRHEQEIFTIEDIIENLWSSVEYPSKATVRSHLRYLRQKLKQAGLSEDPIETLKGRGYCLKSPTANHPAEVAIYPPENNFLASEFVRPSEPNLVNLSTNWDNYCCKNYQQLLVLENTLEACKAGSLTSHQQEEARLVAHNLAQTMELIGFEETSQLARELKIILQQKIVSEVELIVKLEAIVNNLCTHLSIDDDLSSQITESSPVILIIDHDQEFTDIFSQKVITIGMQTTVIPSPKVASIWFEGLTEEQQPYMVILRLSFTKSKPNDSLLEEYLSLIRQFNSLTPSLPVIVIADRDRFEERLLVSQQGASFFLKQPITAEEVITFCQRVLQSSPRDKKVMLVDDDIDLLRILPSALQPWGLIATTLDDTRQFWDVLQAVEPDLLVLEIDMPYLTGIELGQVIRTHSSWYRLPIIYTSIYQTTDLDITFQGMDDFLPKPFTSEQLADCILHSLKKTVNI